MQSSRPSPRSPSPWASKGVDVATGAKTGRGGRVCKKKAREFGGGSLFCHIPICPEISPLGTTQKEDYEKPRSGGGQGSICNHLFLVLRI